jgi:hypothetical protein
VEVVGTHIVSPSEAKAEIMPSSLAHGAWRLLALISLFIYQVVKHVCRGAVNRFPQKIRQKNDIFYNDKTTCFVTLIPGNGGMPSVPGKHGRTA